MSFVAGLLMLPVSIVFRGWVIAVLWGWFIVPVFGMQPIRVPLAAGLSCFASVLWLSTAQDNKDFDKCPQWLKQVVLIFVQVFVLGVGWLIHLWATS